MDQNEPETTTRRIDQEKYIKASVKVGRKYELQKKIDLELEKLYAQMEADGTLVKDGIGQEDVKPTATVEKISDEKETAVSSSGDVMDVKMNGLNKETTQQEEEQQETSKDDEVATKQPQENDSNTPQEEDQNKDIGTDKDVRVNGDVAKGDDVKEHEELSRSSPEIIITKCDGESESLDKVVNTEDKQNEVPDLESTTTANDEVESDLKPNINNETESQQELKNDIHNSQEHQSETQIDNEPNDMLTNETTAAVEDGDVQDDVEEPAIAKEEKVPVKSQSLEEEEETEKHSAQDAAGESAVVNEERVPVESQSLEEIEAEREKDSAPDAVAEPASAKEEEGLVETQSINKEAEKELDSAVVVSSELDKEEVSKDVKASDAEEEDVLQEEKNDDEVKEDLARQNMDATEDDKIEEAIGVETAEANMQNEEVADAPKEKTDDVTEAKEEHPSVQTDEEAENVDEKLTADSMTEDIREEVIDNSVSADAAHEDDKIEDETVKDGEEAKIVEQNIKKSEDSPIKETNNEPQQIEDKNQEEIHEPTEEPIKESSSSDIIKEDPQNQIEDLEESALNEGTTVDQIDGGGVAQTESSVESDLAGQAQINESENVKDDDVQLAVHSHKEDVNIVEEKTESKEEEDDLNVDVAKEKILVLDDKEDVVEEVPTVSIEDGTSVDVVQESNVDEAIEESKEEELPPQEEMSVETSEDKQVQIIDNENDVHPTEDEKDETSKESTDRSDQNTSTNLEGSEMEQPTPVMFSGGENEGVTAEDIAEAMKDRPSSSQQSTPSYQNLVGDIDEEVRQNEELEDVKDEEVVEEQPDEDDSSSSSNSSSNSEEDFSGNDIDLEDPNEYLDQSESLQQDEGTSVDAPQIAPLDDVSEKSVVSDGDTSRLATEIVNEAVNLAVAYIDKNNEEGETEVQQTDVECSGDNDVTADGPDVRSYTVNDIEEIESETTEKESRNDAIELPTESYQKDDSLGDIESKQTEAVQEDEQVIEETQQEEDPKEQEAETEEVAGEESSEDQQVSEEMKDEKENDMPKPVYNPALSQRNTEAEKWFGQPTSEDKIFMRPKGKLDMSAEMERKKLIKSMTRRNNPKIVSKWQPPTEKNWEDNLEGQQKESLEKYKQRRQNRISFTSHPTEDSPSDKPQVENKVTETPVEEPASQQQSEDIVVEPVVHSRDAISKWEHILHEKTEKEETERKRLSVGKQQRTPRPFEMHRTRKDSDSSVSSNTSSNAPPSDMIVRESMNIKDIRNRWKNIEEESKQTKPPTNIRRQSTGTNRGGNTFTVKAAPMYRPYMRPSPAKEEQPKMPEPVNHPRKPKSKIIPGESFIDREIREAAEREEEYKHEFASKSPEPQKEAQIQEEDVVAKLKKLPSRHTEDIITQTIKEDAEKESQWKEAHHIPPHTDAIQQDDEPAPQVQGDVKVVCGGLPVKTIVPHQREVDAESISSYGSSGMSNEAPLSPASRKRSSKMHATSTESHHQEADSGIECNNQISSSSPEPKPVVVEAPVQAVLTRQKTASEFQEELLRSLQEEEPEQPRTVEPKQVNQRARLSSLHTVTPKGWGQTPTTAKPISPVSPGHKKVLAPFSSKKTNGVDSPTEVKQYTPNTFKVTPQKNTNNHNNRGAYDDNHWHGALRKTVDVPQKKAGPVFQITSSNVSTQSAMKKEIEDAKRREEEWLRKQRAGEADRVKQAESENVNNNNNIVNNNHSPPKPVARKQVGEGVAGTETAE